MTIPCGIDDETGEPRHLTPEQKRRANILVAGSPGSLKSATFALPLMLSLMPPNEDGEHESQVVFDFSADQAICNALRLGAESHGLPFHVISLDNRFATRKLDVLRSSKHPLTANQIAGLLLAGGGIRSGSGQRPSDIFFAKNNEALAVEVARSMLRDNIPLTLELCAEQVRQRSAKYTAADHLVYALGALLGFDALVGDCPDEERITWDDVTENGAVLYVYAPALEGQPVISAARMMLESLVTFLRSRYAFGGGGAHVHLTIDDAGELTERSMGKVLALSRKLKLSVTLLIQALSQLELEDKGVARTLLNTTQTQVFFTPYDDMEIDHIQAHSRDDPSKLGTITQSASGVALSKRETPNFKMDRNRILEIADTPGMAVVVQRDQTGASISSEPRAVRFGFLYPQEFHEMLVRMPLPLAQQPDSAYAVAIFGWRSPTRGEAFDARATAIEALFVALDNALTGEGSAGAQP